MAAQTLKIKIKDYRFMLKLWKILKNMKNDKSYNYKKESFFLSHLKG